MRFRNPNGNKVINKHHSCVIEWNFKAGRAPAKKWKHTEVD